MRTTLDLDEKLIGALVRESGAASKTEALEQAAREYLRILRIDKMVGHFGKIEIDPVYLDLRKKDRLEARKAVKRGLGK
jgi:hypothetical protein